MSQQHVIDSIAVANCAPVAILYSADSKKSPTWPATPFLYSHPDAVLSVEGTSSKVRFVRAVSFWMPAKVTLLGDEKTTYSSRTQDAICPTSASLAWLASNPRRCCICSRTDQSVSFCTHPRAVRPKSLGQLRTIAYKGSATPSQYLWWGAHQTTTPSSPASRSP